MTAAEPRVRWASIALLSLLAGCRSQEQQESERLDRTISSISVASTVARAWLDNRLPARFVERTLEIQQQQLAKDSARHAAELVSDLRTSVASRQTARTASTIDQLNILEDSVQAVSARQPTP